MSKLNQAQIDLLRVTIDRMRKRLKEISLIAGDRTPDEDDAYCAGAQEMRHAVIKLIEGKTNLKARSAGMSLLSVLAMLKNEIRELAI